jgi:hypothetical protein
VAREDYSVVCSPPNSLTTKKHLRTHIFIHIFVLQVTCFAFRSSCKGIMTKTTLGLVERGHDLALLRVVQRALAEQELILGQPEAACARLIPLRD